METFTYRGREYPKYALQKRMVNGFEELVAVETREWSDYYSRQKLICRLQKAGIPEEFATRTLSYYKGDDPEENIPRLQFYLDNFKSRFHRAHLYLWSPINSTQKSLTAKIMAKELIARGHTARMVLMADLSRNLQQESRDEEAARFIELCRDAEFLVLDDCFDVQKMTLYKSGYQLGFIDAFLRQRMEVDGRAVLFTSNVDPETIGHTFTPSIQKMVLRQTLVLRFNETRDDFAIDKLWEGYTSCQSSR